MLIIGDVQVHSRRGDPATAFQRMRDTLTRADLVYANLEGLLVTSVGTKIDIPDKPEWTHPGPDGVKALKPNNINVVGVANNVASGRQNILKSLAVLDANGIAHVGAGKDLDAAHAPAIVERKGVKIGFLQYTGRWYRDADALATASEPGVARLASRDGVTIDPGTSPASRPTSRRCGRRSTSSSCRTTTATARRRCSSTASRAPSRRRIAPAPRPTGRQFAPTALDAGADLVFGHGTHTVQGVELYNGKPILYAIGHSNFDQRITEGHQRPHRLAHRDQGQEDHARVVRAGDPRRQEQRLPARSRRPARARRSSRR